MKLKKLELTGFKSFHEKTCLNFPPGISAVVGPNGCGKSNVMDALRWVMGEQSVRQLRGKSMEDVIFAGTAGRSMLNMAEVSLTLINDNGTAPESLREFSEIMLTRRLYRSGESVYLINKQPCRLKDIHNVFMGSGMGARSYALIQQGNIGAITEAGPEERRGYIEEAAGTTRYKASKTEALRKLEATHQNLQRLTDILTEVTRQMKSLERQVQKAERYRKLRKKIRRLDIHLGIGAHEALSSELQRHRTLRAEAGDQDLAARTRSSRLEAAIADIRHNHAQLTEALSEGRNRQFDGRRRIDQLESGIRHLKTERQRLTAETETLESTHQQLQEKSAALDGEISELETRAGENQSELTALSAALAEEKAAYQAARDRLTGLKTERDAQNGRIMELTGQEARHQHVYQHACTSRETLQRRLKRIDEEVHTASRGVIEAEKADTAARTARNGLQEEIRRLSAGIDAQKIRLQEAQQALGRQIKQTQALDLEKSRSASKYGALKKMADNFEWYSGGVRAVMKAAGRGSGTGGPQLTGIIGPVAGVLNPAPSYEAALEAALGESLQYLLAEDAAAALQAISFLQESRAGRCGFLLLDAIQPSTETAGSSQLPESGRELTRHIDVPPGHEFVSEALLAGIEVAETLEEALPLLPDAGRRRTFVTRDGLVACSPGILVGGSGEASSGILAKKKELADLAAEIDRQTAELEGARKIQAEMEAGVRQQETLLQKSISQKTAAVQAEVEAEKTAYKAQEALKQARRRLELAELEQEQLGGEDQDMAAEIDRNAAALNRIRTQMADTRAALSAADEAIAAVSRDTEAVHQRWMDCQMKENTLTAQLENARSTLKRLKGFREDGLQRIAQILRQTEENRRKISDAEGRIRTDEGRLAQEKEAAAALDADLKARQREFEILERQVTESSAELGSLHREREKAMEVIRLLELEISRLALKQEHIETRLTETYHLPFAEICRKAAAFAPDAELTLQDMEAELDRLKSRMAGIGEVNLEAVHEFEALKERLAFLETQREDLNKAMDDLHKLIRKINRITQERFLETFHALNEKIRDIFPRLFEGGTAELVLTDPDKPLETGVEFMIQPPGKKLTRISLLSGGEKALSAIAFIFSIFLIKPAAFCLMDEIDAPLDEANVLRFNRLLKLIGQKSQIVMITHNKHSMSFADTLLGITMEQKGVSKVVAVRLEKQETGGEELRR